ncbi:hypothetical protein BDV35DRAFT_352452 [Aspergillus flavus]|uniref:Secreted protein n=1 Tax=Aspergillus flavus TaxID=5059 RepID=A0A5N6H2G1_ASPFL|nr:hypothetical protein BDV35DRAFT_352452 [Aspergillus flavus]
MSNILPNPLKLFLLRLLHSCRSSSFGAPLRECGVDRGLPDLPRIFDGRFRMRLPRDLPRRRSKYNKYHLYA